MASITPNMASSCSLFIQEDNSFFPCTPQELEQARAEWPNLDWTNKELRDRILTMRWESTSTK